MNCRVVHDLCLSHQDLLFLLHSRREAKNSGGFRQVTFFFSSLLYWNTYGVGGASNLQSNVKLGVTDLKFLTPGNTLTMCSFQTLPELNAELFGDVSSRLKFCG